MWNGVITDKGNELLMQWTAGRTLTLTYAAGGTGTADELLTQTALVKQMQTASVVKNELINGRPRIKIQLTANVLSYSLNQIGFWARLDDGEETLIALFQNDDGVEIPSAEDMPDFAYTFYALLGFSNTGGELNVTIDAAALVTADMLNERVDSAIQEMIGKPGGAASLDENGKLLPSQLPDASQIACGGYESVFDAVTEIGGKAQTAADDIAEIKSGNVTVGNAEKLGGQEPSYYATADAVKAAQAAADNAQTAAGTAQTAADEAKAAIVNRNMLRNWYFANPVNSAGLTEYSGKGFTIDCWRNNCPAGVVTLTEDGLTLGEMKWFIQTLEEDPTGETLTASILMSSGELLTKTLSYTGNTASFISNSDPEFYFQLRNSDVVSGKKDVRIVNFAASDAVTIAAVKLEYGSEQTLAVKNSSGKWVLREIPDYAEQAALCAQFADSEYIGAAQRFAKVQSYTDSVTLTAVNAENFLAVDSSTDVTVTVPTDDELSLPVGTELEVCRMGEGAVTFAAGSLTTTSTDDEGNETSSTVSVTLLSAGGNLSISEQYGSVALKKIAANRWLLSGNLG